jgi:hypothetical protein
MGQLLNSLKTKFPFSSGEVANQTGIAGGPGAEREMLFSLLQIATERACPSASAG